MNILILSPSLKVGGGAEKFSSILGNELNKKNYQIYHLAFSHGYPLYDFQGEYSSLNEYNGQKGLVKGIISLIKKSLYIKNFCKKNDISIIISIGENQNYHAILSKYLFKNDVKILATQLVTPERYLNDKIGSNMTKILYPKSDKVICCSKGIEIVLKRDYNIQNTITIYNFLDLDNIEEESKASLPDKYIDNFKSGFIFINIGRLDYQKGQWHLIRSFREVVDNHNDAKLYILGEGELRKELEQLIIKLNLEKNVFLIGNQINIFPFLKKSNCFFLSSLWEGFPLTLIASLAMRLPTISTDCKTGPRECICPEIGIDQDVIYPYYGNYGILTKPFNQKIDFDEIKNEPINESEKMATYLMNEMIDKPDLVIKYSKKFNFNSDMDRTKIIEEWEKLIN